MKTFRQFVKEIATSNITKGVPEKAPPAKKFEDAIKRENK
jgi:hypothetical protein